MPTEAQNETRSRKLLNGYLAKICSKYYDTLSEPIALIDEAVKATGFNTEALEGFYCGEKGQARDQIGKRTWLVIQWYKMSSGRWEVNSYAS
jgi:hypothetical protein